MDSISLPAQSLFTIWGLRFTNAQFSAAIISLFTIILAIISRRKFSLIPSRIQLVVEQLSEFLIDQLVQATGDTAKARKLLPLILTLMIFITLANQFSVLPLVSQLVYGDTPLMRTVTADLNATIALSLVVVITAHLIALKLHPIGHLFSYIPIDKIFAIRKPLDIPAVGLSMFLGLLDMIGEISKIMSLSFRLFGNIFAGEVMITVISGLAFATRFFVPMPFILLSLFSGFVQAFVFTMLAIQFTAAFYSSDQSENKIPADN